MVGGLVDGAAIQRLSLDEFHAIQPQWDSVAFGSPDGGPMLSHSWLRTTARSKGTGGQDFLFYIAHTGSQPVAIGAFEVSGGICRTLQFGGGLPLLDASGVAYVKGAEAAGFEIMRTAIESSRFDRLVLAGPPPPLAEWCAQLPVANMSILRDAKILVDFHSLDWAEYRRISLAGEYWSDLHRRERRLGEAGCLALRRVEDARTAMAALGRLHIRRGANQGNRSEFGGQGLTYLYSHAWQAARDGQLASYQLLLDSEPIAAILALEHGRRASMTHMAYDPAYHRYGPGMILIYRMLQDVYRRGLQTFDFGVGDLPFKRRFGNREEPWFVVSGRKSGLKSWVRSAPVNTLGQLKRGPVRFLGRRLLLHRAGGARGQLSFLESQLGSDPKSRATQT